MTVRVGIDAFRRHCPLVAARSALATPGSGDPRSTISLAPWGSHESAWAADRAVRPRGGARDLGLLQNSLARPRSGYYASLSGRVVAMLQSRAGNHAFAHSSRATYAPRRPGFLQALREARASRHHPNARNTASRKPPAIQRTSGMTRPASTGISATSVAASLYGTAGP